MVKQISITFLLFLLMTATAYGDDISLEISVDKAQLAMDDQLTLTLSVQGTSQNLPTAQIPTIPNFDIVGQSTTQNFQVINGAVSASKDTRLVLIPKKMGSLQIGPFQMNYQGKTIQSNAITVTVTKPGSTVSNQAGSGRGDIFIDVIIDRKNPYLHEQVTVTYYLYFRLSVTGLDYQQLPTTTGFWAEELDVPKDRSGNFQTEQKNLNGIRYNRVMLKKMALFPSTIGKLIIGPMVVNTQIRTQSRDPFDSFFSFGRTENRVVRAPELSIQVKDLPAANKPAGFHGAVGQFSLKAEVNKTDLPANEATTLTVTLSGTGNIRSIPEPELKLPADFKKFGPETEEKVNKQSAVITGTKTFQYELIPRYEGDYVIEPLQLSYFDPQKEVYRTITTNPIHIIATESTGGDEFVYVGSNKEEVRLLRQDIRFIKTISGPLKNVGQPVYTKLSYLGGYLLALMVFIGSIVYRQQRNRLEMDVGYARKRHASRVARKLSNEANKAFKKGDREKFYSAVAHALSTFIADKWNLPVAAVTADTVDDILKDRGIKLEVIDQVKTCLNTCNFARFAPATELVWEEMKSTLKDAKACISQLEKHRQ